jgi:hypothetical protein
MAILRTFLVKNDKKIEKNEFFYFGSKTLFMMFLDGLNPF